MKSVYIDNHLHSQLKTLSSLKNKSLSELIAEFLEVQFKKAVADLSTVDLQKLANAGQSFKFLNNPDEDIYSATDGEPVL